MKLKKGGHWQSVPPAQQGKVKEAFCQRPAGLRNPFI